MTTHGNTVQPHCCRQCSSVADVAKWLPVGYRNNSAAAALLSDDTSPDANAMCADSLAAAVDAAYKYSQSAAAALLDETPASTDAEENHADAMALLSWASAQRAPPSPTSKQQNCSAPPNHHHHIGNSMSFTTTISIATVDEINQHHRAAQSHATKAMDHAKQAGELLLRSKAAIAHGGWLRWLEENCEVSARQAQRYMGVAEGKPTPIRAIAKNDTVSHSSLPAEAFPDKLKQWIDVPEFIPTPGHWMLTATAEAGFHVMPSLEHPGFFHVSKLYTAPALTFDPMFHSYEGEPDSFFDATRRPVWAAGVEGTLQHLGLAEPSKAKWTRRVHAGLLRPFGEPEDGLGAHVKAGPVPFDGSTPR